MPVLLFWCNSHYKCFANLLIFSLIICSFIHPRYHQYQHLVCRPVVYVSLFYRLLWIKNTVKKTIQLPQVIRKLTTESPVRKVPNDSCLLTTKVEAMFKFDIFAFSVWTLVGFRRICSLFLVLIWYLFSTKSLDVFQIKNTSLNSQYRELA